MKVASLALLENDASVIYIDTTNYMNNENIAHCLRVTMSVN